MATYDQLVKALQKADAKGDAAGIDYIMGRIKNRDYEEQSNTAMSAMQGFGQGATFGLAD